MSFEPEFIANLMGEILVDDFVMKVAFPFASFVACFSFFLGFCGIPLIFIALCFFKLKCLRQDYLWKKHFE